MASLRSAVAACWLATVMWAVSCSSSPGPNGPDAGGADAPDAADATLADGSPVLDAGSEESTEGGSSDGGDSMPPDSGGVTLDASLGCGCGSGRKTCPPPSGAVLHVNLCVPADSDPAVWGCGATCGPCTASTPGGQHASSSVCLAGACAPGSCEPGWSDCNGVPSDGCEADLTTDMSNCGACGNACTGNESCLDGTCATACVPPLTDCGGVDGGEVCANLLTSPNNCGACNSTCAGTCAGGKCTVTPPPCSGAICSGSCVDTASDPSNCGSCGASCGGADYNAACVGGQCTTCPPGTVYVASGPFFNQPGCVDPTREVVSCGGMACPSGTTCSNSACVPLSSYLIATGVSVDDFAVGSQNLYFVDSDGGTVNAVPVGGGVVTPVASAQASPLHVAVDAVDVYWSNNLGGAIMQVPTTGGPPALAVAASEPTELLTDGTSLYWINGTDQSLNTMVVATRVTSQIAQNAGFGPLTYNLQQNATTLFAVLESDDSSAVEAFSKAGAPNNVNLPSCPSAFPIDVQGILGYAVSDTQSAITCHEELPATYMTSPLFGTWGTHSVSYEDPLPTGANPLIDSDGTVYFVATPGIRRIAPCTNGVVIPEVVIDVPGITKIALDGTFVYWTDGASLGRVAK